MVLSKNDILGADDLPFQEIEVPEWGGTIRLKTLMEDELGPYEEGLIDMAGESRRVVLKNMRAKLLVLAIVDEKGKRLFNDNEIAALAKKSAKAMDRVFTVAQKMNGLGKDYVDDMVKNLGTGTENDSNTD